MSLIWIVMPSIAFVLSIILLFAGFAKLANLKPFAGVARLAFGSGFFAIAVAIGLIGVNLQTFKRLTYERPVATVKFTALPDEADTYRADVVFSDGQTFLLPDGTAPVFQGNEWQIGAKVVKFKPMANILGYDSIYRLEHMRALDAHQFSSDAVKRGTVDGIKFVESEPGNISVADLAAKYGSQFGIDAEYGSATYQPMGDGYEFEVSITQDALIARPTPGTREKIQEQAYPGFKPIGGSKR